MAGTDPPAGGRSALARPAPSLVGNLLAVSVGGVAVMHGDRRDILTGFRKSPVDGPVRLGRLGLPGDEHAYSGHGGADRAVCVYAHEHYAHWAARYGLDLPSAAAFGENFTVSGLLETEVCLGDAFAIGTAIVQVTVPRAPCSTIAARYGVPQLAIDVERTGFTGFLMRVLQEGDVEAGQALRLIHREGHAVTVAAANRVLNAEKDDADGIRDLLDSGALPADQHQRLRRRLDRLEAVGADPAGG